MPGIRLIALIAALVAPLVASGQRLPALPALNLDIAQTSVSGLSSGAFMAVQLEVAHASIIIGAGVVAGGPYYCAQDDVVRATTRCSCTLDPGHALCSVSATSTDVPALERVTHDFFAERLIDDPALLARHRVLIVAGAKDPIVPAVVAAQLEAYYRRFAVSALSVVLEPDLGHTLPTVAFGRACDVTDAPYLGRCGFSAAHAILQWIYGPLREPRARFRGRFIRFDQSRYVPKSLYRPTGMDRSAWLYVPRDCEQGARCRLHVALHGCKQGQNYASLSLPPGKLHNGTLFVRHAGYAESADANRIVVLFPQAVSIPLANPEGCWDWWGYSDSHYADQNGVQIRAMRAMIDRLASGAH